MRRGLAVLLLVCAIACCRGVSSGGVQGGHEPRARAGAAEAGPAAEGKLLIVVMDKVTWHDLLSEQVRAPTLRRLAEEGAPGMMCVRAGRGFAGEYATLGAGSRAASRPDPALRVSVEADGWQATERVAGATAAREFELRTGWRVGGNAIVHLGIGELIRQNEEALYPVRLGLLGAALRRAGVRVACVGNADTGETRHRELVALAMDEHGLVPRGDVSRGLLHPARQAPYRLTFDPARLAEAVRRLSRWAEVIVLDPGETARVEEWAARMTPAAAAAGRRRAIEKTDRLLRAVLPALPRGQWSVLVITPSLRAPEPEEAFAALAPVIWWSRRERPRVESRESRVEESESAISNLESRTPSVESRLLTSPSTRRPGLVVNTDVAPSVLDYFGLPVPKEMVGRPFDFSQGRPFGFSQGRPFGFSQGRPLGREKVQGRALGQLRADLARHDAVERVRPQLSRALAVVGAIALWLSALLMLIGKRAPAGARVFVRGLLVVALSAPAAMLLIGLWAPASDEPALQYIGRVAGFGDPALQHVGAVIGLSLVIALLSGWLTRWRSGYGAASVLVVGLLAYDVFRGQQMLYWSPLSYSPAAGSRFYGIGNEYAGVLLGAALMAAAWLLPPRDRGSSTGRALAGLVLLALAVVVGLPNYGANLGMSLSIGLGAAVFCLYLWSPGGRVGWPRVVAAAVAAVVVVGGAMALDYHRHGPETSHIGRWMAAVQQQGWPAAFTVAGRKLSMNFMLLRTSLWTDAAVAGLAVLVAAVAARPLGAGLPDGRGLREARGGCAGFSNPAPNDEKPAPSRLLGERGWLTPGIISGLAGAGAACLLNDSGIVAAALALIYLGGSLGYAALGEREEESASAAFAGPA